jgi:hypothetical protein
MQCYRIAKFGCARNHETYLTLLHSRRCLLCRSRCRDQHSIRLMCRSKAMIGCVSLGGCHGFRRQRDGEMISWPEVGMVEGPCLCVPWFVLLRLFSCRLVRHSNEMTRRDIHTCTLFRHNSALPQRSLRPQNCDGTSGAMWKVKSRCFCARS